MSIASTPPPAFRQSAPLAHARTHLRPVPDARVSCPLEWEEVADVENQVNEWLKRQRGIAEHRCLQLYQDV